MTVRVRFFGESRSFPRQEHPFTEIDANVLVLAGENAGAALATTDTIGATAVLVELGAECLGQWTGEARGIEGSNVIGFNRFRLGTREPSNLVELVVQPGTNPDALAAARETFESTGLNTAVCRDFAGRIVDRLVRPYLNAALQALDEQLATADDLDLTVRLGLGYPEGPISLLEDSGLAQHHDVSRALYEAYGEIALVPARRARVAAAMQDREVNRT